MKKLTNNNVNNAVQGTRSWWSNIKNIIGEQPSKNRSTVVHIGDSWLSKEEFAEKLNQYYLEHHDDIAMEFPDIPTTSCAITVDEQIVYNLLCKIKTNKATN